MHSTESKSNDNTREKEPSTLVSRNVTVQKRRTSVRLEPEMWTALKEIAALENCTIHDICTLISVRKKENTSLTAAVRVFQMEQEICSQKNTKKSSRHRALFMME